MKIMSDKLPVIRSETLTMFTGIEHGPLLIVDDLNPHSFDSGVDDDLVGMFLHHRALGDGQFDPLEDGF